MEETNPIESGLNEACGVFACVAAGIWPTKIDVAYTIYLGLIGLQHRGQESAGIVTSDGVQSHQVSVKRGSGLVSSIFTDDVLQHLSGNVGIGHTRYSTAGGTDPVNCQPFVVDTLYGLIAVAHNGEIVNAAQIRQQLLKHGVGLSTYSDSELVTQLLTHMPDCGEPNGANWAGRIRKMMKTAHLSYSLVIMHRDRVYAIRDPFGNRPLCVGKLSNAKNNRAGKDSVSAEEDGIDGWVVASESCCFQSIGAKYHREVLPGEVLEVSSEGLKTLFIAPRPQNKPPAVCIFEYVYFSRADSILEGQMVYTVRKRCGMQLAIESPVEADLVATVPESATPAAIGYAEQTGLPYGEVLCKNRYIGRTFIQPNTKLRQLGVVRKFGALTENLRNKRIVLVDDSIVRGTTMAPIIQLLRASGASQVHVRIASPPIKHPCYMGINIPTKEELIANRFEVSDLASHFGADTLKYLSVQGLVLAVQTGIKFTKSSISDQSEDRRISNSHANDEDHSTHLQESKDEAISQPLQRDIGHCTACLTGSYPMDPNCEW